MALFQGSVYSECLQMETELTVFLPSDKLDANQREQRTLYLLHGLTDGCSSWLRNTSVCRYAGECNVAVIMPEGHRSFYRDFADGARYFSYIFDELPTICKKLFALSFDPKDTMIAGNSMGGHGALRCFFSDPLRYLGGCFAFSPVVHVKELPELLPDGMTLSLGEVNTIDYPGSSMLDLALSARLTAKSAPHISCGSDDFILPQNRLFHRELSAAGIPHNFEERYGSHCWEFWDDEIKAAMRGVRQ